MLYRKLGCGWQALAPDYFEPRKAHKGVYSETVTQKDTVRKMCGDLRIKSHSHAPALARKCLSHGSALRSRAGPVGTWDRWFSLPTDNPRERPKDR